MVIYDDNVDAMGFWKREPWDPPAGPTLTQVYSEDHGPFLCDFTDVFGDASRHEEPDTWDVVPCPRCRPMPPPGDAAPPSVEEVSGLGRAWAVAVGEPPPDWASALLAEVRALREEVRARMPPMLPDGRTER